MAQQIGKLQTLTGGISTISKKLGPPNSVAWERSIDFRSDPAEQTTYSQTKKISGSIVTDLSMFADVAGDKLYLHGNTGNIYSVDLNDAVTKEYSVPNSSGNGIVYFAETGQLYIPTNNSITRRSNAVGNGNFYDNFLETEGGAPTNTGALSLIAASSQSATRASTASLSLSGDLTLEAYLKPTSLPTGVNKMSIISKWDESGGKLGYKLDIVPTSSSFGNGQDGALTISVNTTNSPSDSACSGTAGSYTLSATNAAFATGQEILIHQTQGANAGQYERNTIQSYTSGAITLVNRLQGSYAAGAQVLVLKQYTNVTVNGGVTWTAKAWNGTTGGILAFLASGTVTVTGGITATGMGFRGGAGSGVDGGSSYQGEGYTGVGGISTAANTIGGGGSRKVVGSASAGTGGGGHATSGGNGQNNNSSVGGTGGNGGLASLLFGGGSGGNATNNVGLIKNGVAGGGIVFITGATITISGTITAKGADGISSANSEQGPVGGGGGGSIFLGGQSLTLGTNSNANGGAASSSPMVTGGGGGAGYIQVDYYSSYTGSTTPALTPTQDNALGLANGHALRLYISQDGATYETYTQNIDDFTGVYKLYSVSWQASASTAIFYENGQPIGTKTGTKTAINQNAAIFGIGCYVNSSSAKTGFFDGLIDDVRIWSSVRTPAQIQNYYNIVLSGSEANLIAYYPFDGNVNDLQSSNLNNLTANNAPVYSPDVAFKGVSVRGDEDVFLNTNGQTYTTKTSLSELATDKLPFTPTKEPFKSLALNINAVGTGNVTVVVHDELNDVVTSLTVAHADLQAGIYEVKFPSSKRIILNASYHAHVYSTVADTHIVTGTAADLSTAYLKTYFQVLVDDTYHMAVRFQNFICIANERYLATLQSGNIYNPARLIFPSGYRIRSLAFWQQYLVIGMWFGNNMTDTDTGKLFFWDGESDTYIDALDVPQGGINAMLGTQGGLLISAGYKGAFLEYTGYPSSFRYTARTAAQLAFRLPNVQAGDTVEIAPGALTMWNAMQRIGASLNSNSSTLHQGIYTYGQYTDQDPLSVGFDHPLSIGDTTNTNIKIGCLVSRNSKLYAGFQNGITYGIDVVDENADPYPTATIEFLITDLGSVAAKKLPFVFRADFLPLVAGQSVSLKYKPNRASDWLPLGTQNQTGATHIRGIISQRLHEVQFAADIINTDKSVTLTQWTMESNDEAESRQA